MKVKSVDIDLLNDEKSVNQKDIRIGIFGGTFNPIHIGHLRLAEDVREEYNLNKIIFIPTNYPPHKKLQGNIKAEDRLYMVKLSIKDNKYFSVDDVEIKRGGVSYTIDTVRYVYKYYNFVKRPFFILGSDQALSISSWKEIDELAQMLIFIVLLRRNERDKIQEIEKVMKQKKLEFYFFSGRELDINSSEIRKRLKQGKSIKYLVKDEVLNYIKENRIYLL